MSDFISSPYVILVIIFSIFKFDLISFIYDYTVQEDKIVFILFRTVTIYTLCFTDIDYVKETRGGYSYFFAYNCKNRFFGKTFYTVKKTGFFARKLLITPADPTGFVTKLKSAGVKVISTLQRQGPLMSLRNNKG